MAFQSRCQRCVKTNYENDHWAGPKIEPDGLPDARKTLLHVSKIP